MCASGDDVSDQELPPLVTAKHIQDGLVPLPIPTRHGPEHGLALVKNDWTARLGQISSAAHAISSSLAEQKD